VLLLLLHSGRQGSKVDPWPLLIIIIPIIIFVGAACCGRRLQLRSAPCHARVWAVWGRDLIATRRCLLLR
jgi:hypothetical protein